MARPTVARPPQQLTKNMTYVHRLGRNIRAYPSLYLLFIPIFLYFIVFKYGPMGGAVIAFQKYRPARGIANSPWVGLKNFSDFLTGPYAGRVISNTLILNFWQILIGFPAPIILAILLNEMRQGRYKKTLQTVSYLPYFISLVVVCGIIKDFCASDGLFSDILAMLGFERENLLTDPRHYRTIYVLSSLWQSCGWGSILYMATLTNTDQQLYEAATVDGAGRFRRIWHITLPALLPIILVQLIMRIGNIMSYGADRTLLLETHEAYIDQLGPYIVHAHLSDYDRTDEKHWLPGNGVIDWHALLSRLTAAGHQGSYLFEIREYTAVPGSVVSPAEVMQRLRESILPATEV